MTSFSVSSPVSAVLYISFVVYMYNTYIVYHSFFDKNITYVYNSFLDKNVNVHKKCPFFLFVLAITLLLQIHSFISAISIAPLQVLYYSEALPTTARILYRSFTPKRTGNCR